jgi:NAD(P)-dependent dehydrogenase (short-subunit alcohol dehydrogenase family)
MNTITRLAVPAAMGAVAARALVRRRRERFDLDGAAVLITGASRGLGYALAREFGCRGAKLAVCARGGEHLEGARAELERAGADVFAQPCDVGDRRAVSEFVDGVVSRFGGIDVVVNNAGVITVGPVLVQRLEDYREAMDVMLWGVVHPTLAALPHLLARGGGRIVNITSIGGKVSAPHLLPYNTAKFAAVGFSEGLRAELAPYGVKVTTVVPGLMRTGSPRNAAFKGHHRAEYGWFITAASIPGLSMNAERAARLIVDASVRGDPELILTAPAKLAVRAQGMFPGLTSRALGVAKRLLPAADGAGGGGEDRRPGHASESAVTRSPVTVLQRRAEDRLRQHPRQRSG